MPNASLACCWLEFQVGVSENGGNWPPIYGNFNREKLWLIPYFGTIFSDKLKLILISWGLTLENQYGCHEIQRSIVSSGSCSLHFVWKLGTPFHSMVSNLIFPIKTWPIWPSKTSFSQSIFRPTQVRNWWQGMQVVGPYPKKITRLQMHDHQVVTWNVPFLSWEKPKTVVKTMP